MRDASRPAIPGGAKVGLLVLAACTVWLVIQNTLLMAALAWRDPATMVQVGLAVLKAGALVGAKFWASPAAAALAAAVLLALLLRRVPVQAREGARHG